MDVFLAKLAGYLNLPWAICVLCNMGWFFVCKALWTRLNTIQDLRVSDSQSYSQKYNEVVSQVNQTLNTLAAMLGRK